MLKDNGLSPSINKDVTKKEYRDDKGESDVGVKKPSELGVGGTSTRENRMHS